MRQEGGVGLKSKSRPMGTRLGALLRARIKSYPFQDIMGPRPELGAIWDAMNIKVCGFA
jgi:hypothetical protein